MKLSVVMPVYNESKTIREIVRRVLDVPIEKELLIVDDGSTDGTRDILRELDGRDGIRVFLQPVNQGKGAAVSVGFRQATGDVVVVQDADLEYDPNEYPKLLGPIVDGHADVVYGSRFLGGGARRVLYFWHTVGNRFLTLASNMVTNLNLTDMETCYKMFRREVVQTMHDRVAALRHRAGDHGQGRAPRLPDLRGADLVLRPDLRGGQEDRLARRGVGALDDRQALASARPRTPATSATSRWPAWRSSSRTTGGSPTGSAGSLGPRILEIGAGFGNMTRQLDERELIVASDVDPVAVEYLRGAFRDEPAVRIASYRFPLDAAEREEIRRSEDRHGRLPERARAHRGRRRRRSPISSRSCRRAAASFWSCPRWRGSTARSTSTCTTSGATRRPSSSGKLAAAGFTIEDCRFLNRPGILGWYVNGKILRRRVLPSDQLAAFRLMLPLLRREEANPPLGRDVAARDRAQGALRAPGERR